MELKCLVLQLVVSAAFLLIANASECTDGDPWTAPSGWTGPEAAYYKSFDNTKCMTLHNGARLKGKTNPYIETTKSRKQYVDLGVIADKACIVSPSTCTSGGTISAWISFRVYLAVYGPETLYAMSSFDEPKRSPSSSKATSYEGFFIRQFTRGNVAAFLMSDSHASGHMTSSKPRKGTWFYITIVYHADTKKQDTYINGRLNSIKTKDYNFNVHQNAGKLVIGRKFAVEAPAGSKSLKNPYASVAVDDLIAFNADLTAEQVKDLYQSTFG